MNSSEKLAILLQYGVLVAHIPSNSIHIDLDIWGALAVTYTKSIPLSAVDTIYDWYIRFGTQGLIAYISILLQKPLHFSLELGNMPEALIKEYVAQYERAWRYLATYRNAE